MSPAVHTIISLDHNEPNERILEEAPSSLKDKFPESAVYVYDSENNSYIVRFKLKGDHVDDEYLNFEVAFDKDSVDSANTSDGWSIEFKRLKVDSVDIINDDILPDNLDKGKPSILLVESATNQKPAKFSYSFDNNQIKLPSLKSIPNFLSLFHEIGHAYENTSNEIYKAAKKLSMQVDRSPTYYLPEVIDSRISNIRNGESGKIGGLESGAIDYETALHIIRKSERYATQMAIQLLKGLIEQERIGYINYDEIYEYLRRAGETYDRSMMIPGITAVTGVHDDFEALPLEKKERITQIYADHRELYRRFTKIILKNGLGILYCDEEESMDNRKIVVPHEDGKLTLEIDYNSYVITFENEEYQLKVTIGATMMSYVYVKKEYKISDALKDIVGRGPAMSASASLNLDTYDFILMNDEGLDIIKNLKFIYDKLENAMNSEDSNLRKEIDNAWLNRVRKTSPHLYKLVNQRLQKETEDTIIDNNSLPFIEKFRLVASETLLNDEKDPEEIKFYPYTCIKVKNNEDRFWVAVEKFVGSHRSADIVIEALSLSYSVGTLYEARLNLLHIVDKILSENEL